MGGTIAGILVISAVFLAFWCIRKRRGRRMKFDTETIDGEGIISPFGGEDFIATRGAYADRPPATVSGTLLAQSSIPSSENRSVDPLLRKSAAGTHSRPLQPPFSQSTSSLAPSIPQQGSSSTNLELFSFSGNLPSEITDAEAAVLARMYTLHVPAADIAYIIATMSGQRGVPLSTLEEAQLLRRLHAFHVPPSDITLIVDAMRRCDDDGEGRVGHPGEEAPPEYNLIGE